MSYYHASEMHPALARHLAESEHRLVIDPVTLPADGTVPALVFHGGPTIPSPKLVALYAGRFWGDRTKNDQFLKELMEYGYLSGFRSQGTDNGHYLGGFDLPAPSSGSIVDADCQAMIKAALGQNGVPQPDVNTLYMLILPDGVKVSFTAGGQSSCTQFCAYHSNTGAFYYAVQPANTCNTCNQGTPQDALQMTEAHELIETCSDPSGRGWFNDQTGQENADECAWIQLHYGPWVVQGAAAQNAAGAWVNTVGTYTAPTPGPPPPQPHFQPSGPAAAAWTMLEAGGPLATAELTLLLDSDPNGPAAPIWRYLLAGGNVQTLLDSPWGAWFHARGAA